MGPGQVRWEARFGEADRAVHYEVAACERAGTPQLRLGRSKAISGGKLALAGEFQQLIDGQREYAEHQMRHDLMGSAHPHHTGTELVF
jgi:hypothetical protein